MPGEKPLWKTAGGLSAIAAIVTAVGTLVPTLLNLGGDSPDPGGIGASPTVTPQVSMTALPSDLPEPERVIFEDPLLTDAGNGWEVARGLCDFGFTGQGYGIRVHEGPASCVDIPTSPRLPVASDVAAEVTAAFSELPRSGRDRDVGGFSLVCRFIPGEGTYYSGHLANDGTVRIARFDKQGGDVLTHGKHVTSPLGLQVKHRLRFVCLGGSASAPVELRFYVNGELVATATDSRSLLDGGVGVAAITSTTRSVAVEFTDFKVAAE